MMTRGRGLAVIVATLLSAAAPAHAARSGDFEVTTHPYSFGQAPDWMPDGEHIAFRDNFGEGQQVYISKLNGSERRCLTCSMPAPNMVAVVQPGGQRVLFHSWQGHNLTIGAPGLRRNGLGPLGGGRRRD